MTVEAWEVVLWIDDTAHHLTTHANAADAHIDAVLAEAVIERYALPQM